MSSFGVIREETPRRCQLCGRTEECRPYGPNGEDVCFDCGMKDPDACLRGFRKLVLGEDKGEVGHA